MKKLVKNIFCFLFPNKRITLRMIHGLYRGIKLNVAIKNQLGIILYPNETDLQSFLSKNLEPGDTAFDIGSYIGYTSILTSKIVRENGHVYSFEPISENLLNLERNIKLNKCKNISIINKAPSNKNGESEFIIQNKGENLGMSSMVWGKKKYNTKKQLVKTIRVDDDSTLRYLSPKTIKIDVEGAEGLVIEGMQNLISRCRPYIYIECTSIGREITWSILKSLNYSCFNTKDDKDEVIDFNSYKSNEFIWTPNQ
jgi:FkbM family methyltransferase